MRRAMSRRRLGEAGNWQCGPDRLSCLPDTVIHHILSFLETKYSVQTSVLSRRWRCVWKSVPVLNLNGDSREWSKTQFSRFVDKVLSLRYPLTVNEINYDGYPYNEDENVEEHLPFVDAPVEDPLAVRILEYAASHGTRHLKLAMESLSDPDDFNGFRFPNLCGTTFDRNNIQVLELGSFCIDKKFASLGFGSLITLKLNTSWFCLGHGRLDPFSKFPCLKNLVLEDLRRQAHQRLRISGRQLCNLELLLVSAEGIEICAPKLKYLKFHNVFSIKFSWLDLPSLDHADIEADDNIDFEDIREIDWVSMFNGFRNVKSLTLCDQIFEELCEISEFLGQQASPFTRLETLELWSSPKDIPYTVVNYFLKGSSCANPSIKTY